MVVLIIRNTLIYLACALFIAGNAASAKSCKIGVLLPAQHRAIDEIASGFEEEAEAILPQCEISFDNALGDANLMRSIIEKYKNTKVDLVVPVGTVATQMSVQLLKGKFAMVSVAASKRNLKGSKRMRKPFELVSDELSAEAKLKLIRAVLPDAKRIALVHSLEARINKEAAELTELASQSGIDIVRLPVQNMQDLNSVVRNIGSGYDAFLTLKDHLVVGGITTLLKAGHKNNIPIVAMDEGSVKEGADIAVGMSEKQLGSQGARAACRALSTYCLAQAEKRYDNNKLTFFWQKNSLFPKRQINKVAAELGLGIVEVEK